MKVVSELVANHIPSEVQGAQEDYNKALRLMEENPGQWVEVQTARLLSREHKAMWEILMKWHDVSHWAARYPEVGVCVLYARVPEKTSQKVRKWFRK